MLTLQSGLPFSPGLSSSAPLNTPGYAYRPDKLGDAGISDQSRNKWFNAGPATIETVWGIPGALKFGTAARNSLLGPGVATLDMSFFKSFVLWEETRLQFRAEFFNLFNRTNLSNPNGSVGEPAGGPDLRHFPADASHPVGDASYLLAGKADGAEMYFPPRSPAKDPATMVRAI